MRGVRELMLRGGDFSIPYGRASLEPVRRQMPRTVLSLKGDAPSLS